MKQVAASRGGGVGGQPSPSPLMCCGSCCRSSSSVSLLQPELGFSLWRCSHQYWLPLAGLQLPSTGPCSRGGLDQGLAQAQSSEVHKRGCSGRMNPSLYFHFILRASPQLMPQPEIPSSCSESPTLLHGCAVWPPP